MNKLMKKLRVSKGKRDNTHEAQTPEQSQSLPGLSTSRCNGESTHKIQAATTSVGLPGHSTIRGHDVGERPPLAKPKSNQNTQVEVSAEDDVSAKVQVIIRTISPTKDGGDLSSVSISSTKVSLILHTSCSTCNCLGLAAGDGKDSDWAAVEYNIKPRTLGVEVPVKHTQLLASAASGCLYCILICKSLSEIRPGWEAVESLVSIFYSKGLPVVVRWAKGSSSTLDPVWEDQLQDYALHTIHVKTADERGEIEPDVELEIYRPEIPQKKADYHDLGSLIEVFGLARERSHHTGAAECFKFISEQASVCLSEHNCGSRMPVLPDRVLWVKPDNSGEIRLLEPKDVHAQYIALSYCWGPPRSDIFLTNAATLADRKAGIKIEDLPRLFVGIINCARMLRIDYIWIDRLCIVQGDNADFSMQAPKMGQYYGNATITFTTASADSDMDDILVERDPKWRSTEFNVDFAQSGTLNLRTRQRPYLLSTESQGGYYGQVSTRAWIWQERLLAARNVFFTPSALKFECHHHAVWEEYASGLTSPSWSACLNNMTHLNWLSVVEDFTARDITRSSDRLPALGSVMQRIADVHGWDPVWGMWSEFIEKSLAWTVSDSGDWSGRHRCHVHEGHHAPSWSWASIEGAVDFGRCRPLGDFEAGNPSQNSLKVLGLDKETGVLEVEAHYNFVLIKCSIEHPYEIPAIRYHYTCESVRIPVDTSNPEFADMPHGMPVTADVVLQPVKNKLSLLYDGSIMRVPHGKSLPEETWTSKCLCIMLGHRRTTADVLLLGESQRVPGAYERIGLVSGWPPAMFFKNERLDFKLA